MCKEHETSDIVYPMRLSFPTKRQNKRSARYAIMSLPDSEASLRPREVFVQGWWESSILLLSRRDHSHYEDDDDVAAALALAAPPRPLTRAEPVAWLVVSLLLRPVGCRSCRGMSSLPRYFPATIGPMIKAMKMINIMK